MKQLDRVLQRWRIRKTLPFITSGARVLDVGSSDGALFQAARELIAGGVGIDPDLQQARSEGSTTFVGGYFPKDMPTVEPFDVITMLAVLEHIPGNQYAELKAGCFKYLKPGGHIVITVPSPSVDHILAVLRGIGLIDGMKLEEHHGYQVADTVRIFSRPEFDLVRRGRFQFGLNNLFVFRRSGAK